MWLLPHGEVGIISSLPEAQRHISSWKLIALWSLHVIAANSSTGFDTSSSGGVQTVATRAEPFLWVDGLDLSWSCWLIRTRHTDYGCKWITSNTPHCPGDVYVFPQVWQPQGPCPFDLSHLSLEKTKTYILCGYCNADHTVHCRLIDTLHRTMQRNPHRHSAPESCCMQKAKCCFHHFCSHAVFPRTYCTLSSYFPLLLTMFISSLALHFLAPEALFLPTRWYPCLGWSAALSAHHKRVGLIEPGRKGHREKGVSVGWSAGVC